MLGETRMVIKQHKSEDHGVVGPQRLNCNP
jgi:hypothetical protein